MSEPGPNSNSSPDPSRTIRKFASHEEQALETARYWAGRTIAEKMQATAELVRNGYRARGIDVDAPEMSLRASRAITRVQRERR